MEIKISKSTSKLLKEMHIGLRKKILQALESLENWPITKTKYKISEVHKDGKIFHVLHLRDEIKIIFTINSQKEVYVLDIYQQK